MRVKVVRTPGELRDSIGHKVLVQKDWEGTVEQELTGEAISVAGFHPKQQEQFFLVKFDAWGQPIALPANNLIILDEGGEPADSD